jgi:predicted DNA binding CopG/RHH family protein
MKRQVARFKRDAEAEAFLEQDLSNLDFSKVTPVHFEFEPKTERVSMRLLKSLLIAVKAKALAQGISYQRLIRQALERAIGLAGPQPGN